MLTFIRNMLNPTKRGIEATENASQVDPAVRSLIWAAEKGDVKALRTLLRTMDGRIGDEDGRTALMYAARAGKVECLNLLIPVSDVKAKTRSKQSALHWAATAGAYDCLKALLPFSNANAVDSYRDTALSICARQGDDACVRLLMPATSDCSSALMSAVCLNRPSCVKLLLDRAKPQDCGRHASGETPLSRSVSDGSVECLELLLPCYGEKDMRELRGAAENAANHRKTRTLNLIQQRIAEIEREAIEGEVEIAVGAALPSKKPVRL